jgi:hypothetical protein
MSKYTHTPVIVSGCLVAVLFLPALVAASPATDMGILMGALLKPVCDRLIPHYDFENGANYAAWRRAHELKVEAIEQNTDLRNKQQELLNNLESLSPAERARIETYCSRLADDFQSTAPADPRFASPDKTWLLFRNSLETGDRKTAVLCLAGSAKTMFARVLSHLPEQELREMVGSMTVVDLDPGAASYVEASIIRQDGRSYPIRFIKFGKNWKIAQM